MGLRGGLTALSLLGTSAYPATLLALIVLGPSATARAGALNEHRPLLRYDSAEQARATSVEAITGRHGGGEANVLVDGRGHTIASADSDAPGATLTPSYLGETYGKTLRRASGQDRIDTLGRPLRRGRVRKPVDLVYGRNARGGDGRRWLQYWLFYEDNPQDRGVVETGRHAGDWEFLQVRIDDARRPERVTFAQHSWAESCAWSEVRHRKGGPVVFPANASHATYARPGNVDRQFPNPTDRADGRGAAIRPPVSVITDGAPRWVRWPGRWGESVARPVPMEQSSPRGPAFQDDDRWTDPSAYDRAARSCGSGPPSRPWLTALYGGASGLACVGFLIFGRRRLASRRRSPGDPV